MTDTQISEEVVSHAKAWMEQHFQAGALGVNASALAHHESISELEATAILVAAQRVTEGTELRGYARCPNHSCNEGFEVPGQTFEEIIANLAAYQDKICRYCDHPFDGDLEVRFAFFTQGGPETISAKSKSKPDKSVEANKISTQKKVHKSDLTGSDFQSLLKDTQLIFNGPVHIGDVYTETGDTYTQGDKGQFVKANSDGGVAVGQRDASVSNERGESGGSMKIWVAIISGIAIILASIIAAYATISSAN
jgi:hypothetical protein